MQKAQYFTEVNIQEISKELLEGITPKYREKSKKNMGKSALLVLDMQEYFLNKSSHAFVPSAPHIVPQIIQLMKSFCANNQSIYLTKHTNTPTDAKMMNNWWGDLLSPDSSLSIIIPLLSNFDVPVLNKTQYDAFYQTHLEEFLLKQGVEQIILTGVMTHLCLETTARSAFVRGFSVIIPVDATATYNLEYHRASMINLSHGFAQITSTSVILEDLDQAI